MSTTAVKSSDEQQSTQSLIKVRAKFPFDAPKETHLKFNKDDIIIVTEKQDKWWKGRCHEKVGYSFQFIIFFFVNGLLLIFHFIEKLR